MTHSLLFTMERAPDACRDGAPVRFRCRGNANGSVRRTGRLAVQAEDGGSPLIAVDCGTPLEGRRILQSSQAKLRRFARGVYYLGDLSEAVLAGTLMQSTLAAKDGVALSPKARPLDANFICWRTPGGGVAAKPLKEVTP